MTESIFRKELMLTRQISQKNVCFVITCNFLKKNFKYGPYLCDGCYDIVQKSTDFKNITIVHVRRNAYRIYFPYMNKHKAKKINE